jgi:hypothetical protein
MGWSSFFENFLLHFAMHFRYGMDETRTTTYTRICAENDTFHPSFTFFAYRRWRRLGLAGLPSGGAFLE